jgi:hypothetical protein
LEATVENQKAHIARLERALRQEMSKKEEIKTLREEEIQKSNELINNLRQKLSSCMSSLESKNTELVNLQTALGQYYAESEAKVTFFCQTALGIYTLVNLISLLYKLCH